jgi:pre-mRNA-processing factor 39
MNHCKTVKKEDAAFIRSQYERAMSECGREWRSDKLWDHYVKWEMEAKNYPEVYQLYQRMVRNPTHGLSRNFEAFMAFTKEHNPKVKLKILHFMTWYLPYSGFDGYSRLLDIKKGYNLCQR